MLPRCVKQSAARTGKAATEWIAVYSNLLTMGKRHALEIGLLIVPEPDGWLHEATGYAEERPHYMGDAGLMNHYQITVSDLAAAARLQSCNIAQSLWPCCHPLCQAEYRR